MKIPNEGGGGDSVSFGKQNIVLNFIIRFFNVTGVTFL